MVSIATERAAHGGVPIKDRLALESMRTVDTVLFDKTGTLTKGEPTVTGIEPIEGHTRDEVLALAAAAETDSEHPLARAVDGAARTRDLTVPKATDFSSSPAVGVKATVEGTVGEVGGPYLLDQHGRDGVNDAPALAQADVGIAIGAGTDVAIGSAGVILASSDPRSVLSVIELSRASYRKMKQNLWWAAGYNLAAVPLAAGSARPNRIRAAHERRHHPHVAINSRCCSQRPTAAPPRPTPRIRHKSDDTGESHNDYHLPHPAPSRGRMSCGRRANPRQLLERILRHRSARIAALVSAAAETGPTR